MWSILKAKTGVCVKVNINNINKNQVKRINAQPFIIKIEL